MTDDELKALVASNILAIQELTARQNMFQAQFGKASDSWEETKRIVGSNAQSIEGANERLERTERIVASNAQSIEAANERLERTERIVASNAQSIEGANERLERTERIVESNARSIEGANERLERTERIVESNARSIEAHSQGQSEIKAQREEDRQEWGLRTLTLARDIENLARSLQAEAEQRREEREEKEEEISKLQVSQMETDQRINVLISEIRQLINRKDNAA